MEALPTSTGRLPRRREPLGAVYFGLILFMFVYFLRPEDWIPGLAVIPLAKLTGIVMLVALAFSFNKIRWHLPREIILIALLLMQLWLTVPFSPVWRGGAFNVVLDFSKALPVIIIIYGAVRSMARLRWVLILQAGSAAIIAIVSIVTANPSWDRLRGVVSGIYGNSNDLALVIDISLPLCLAFALTSRSNLKKVAWAIVMLAMVYAVFLTASRAGALALVVAAMVCIWQVGIRNRRVHLLLLAPLALVVIWFYSGNALRQRFEQSDVNSAKPTASSSARDSALQRKGLLLQSLKVTAEHPLFGVGPGNFMIVSGNWHVSHNSYTQISSEGGVPAFILYILILGAAVSNLRWINKSHTTGNTVRLFSMALGASLAAYVVGSFFASLAYQLFPYCLVVYTSALRFIVQKQRAVAAEPVKEPVASAPPPEIEAAVWQ